jgi:hypothetical protein
VTVLLTDSTALYVALVTYNYQKDTRFSYIILAAYNGLLGKSKYHFLLGFIAMVLVIGVIGDIFT